MNANQQIFADEYLRNGRNATKAYMAAYPQCVNENSAYAAASRLLRNVKVSEYINSRLQETSSRRIMSVADIMELYTKIANGEISEQTVTNKGEVVEVVTKVSDRIQAAKALSKMLGAENGLDREKFEHDKAKDAEASGDISVTVNL